MDKFEITFGHLIAYLIPGFIALYPLAHYIPAVASLVGTTKVNIKKARYSLTGSILT